MYQISHITAQIHICNGITKTQYNFCCSFLYFSLSEEHSEWKYTRNYRFHIKVCFENATHWIFRYTKHTHTHTHTYIYIEWPINRWYQMQYCNKINDNYVRIMGAHSIRSCVRVPFLQASQTVQYNRGVKTTASEEIQFVPRGHSIL